MEGRQPNRRGESLTARQKRVFAVTGALLVALLGGLSIWAVANQGSYGRSANGCVNVVLPSTTGGGIMHACGAAARTLCHRAVSEHTELGRLTRPQCRLAGLSR